jgi:chromosome partitioning protein
MQCEGMNYVPNPLGNRKAFSHAAGKGLGIVELNPPDEKASAELNNLFTYIFSNSTN